MFRVRLLLKMLTEEIPPGENQRHNITLDGEGAMEVCLMLGNRFVPFKIEEFDLDRPVSHLVYEIQNRLESLDETT
jgi:hypothetical protein